MPFIHNNQQPQQAESTWTPREDCIQLQNGLIKCSYRASVGPLWGLFPYTWRNHLYFWSFWVSKKALTWNCWLLRFYHRMPSRFIQYHSDMPSLAFHRERVSNPWQQVTKNWRQVRSFRVMHFEMYVQRRRQTQREENDLRSFWFFVPPGIPHIRLD